MPGGKKVLHNPSLASSTRKTKGIMVPSCPHRNCQAQGSRAQAGARRHQGTPNTSPFTCPDLGDSRGKFFILMSSALWICPDRSPKAEEKEEEKEEEEEEEEESVCSRM